MSAPLRVEHLPWCDPQECYIDADPEDGFSSHMATPRRFAIDNENTKIPSDGGFWRSPATGPEVEVRPMELSTVRCVELGMPVQHATSSGSIACCWMTPDEARRVAAMIMKAADDAEVTDV